MSRAFSKERRHPRRRQLSVGQALPGQLWFMAVWEMLEAFFGSAVTAFAMVTLIFAVMERIGVQGDIFSFQEGMDFLPPRNYFC